MDKADLVQEETVSFQSPRSGKIESNFSLVYRSKALLLAFQSPRSGKIESNEGLELLSGKTLHDVSIP